VTLGSSDVTGVNSIEKIYTILCLIFGLLFGSTLVSSLSATMVEFQMLRNGRQQKLRMLRQFLSDNAVDLDISYMVQKQVKERLGPSDSLTEQDVPVLQLLSSQLLAELRMEIHRVNLSTHALFSTWLGMDQSTFITLCSDLFFTFLRAEDQLFHPGEADDTCFNLVKGSLFYLQSPDSSVAVEVHQESPVHPGAWLAEPAMWCYWRHVGTAEARGDCQVLVVPLKVVNLALQTRQGIRHVVQQYAEVYHKRITAARPPDRSYPTDLEVPLTGFEDIIMSMDKESQIAVGLVAMKHCKQNFHFGDAAGGHQKLRSEVEKGKSTVMMSSSGEVLRIVNLATLKVANGRGQVLAQIGVFDADKEEAGIKTECQLPGLKQDRQEEAEEAAQRCIMEKLPALAHVIEVEGTTRLIEYKPSKEFGVRTKYVKTVCTATINESKFNLQNWEAAHNLERYQITSKRPTASRRDVVGLASMVGAWDIYPMMSGRKVFFYSWITAEELANMASAGGDAKVRQRLEALQFNFEAFHFQSERMSEEEGEAEQINQQGSCIMVQGSIPEMMEEAPSYSPQEGGGCRKREQEPTSSGSMLPAVAEAEDPPSREPPAEAVLAGEMPIVTAGASHEGADSVEDVDFEILAVSCARKPGAQRPQRRYLRQGIQM